MSYFKTLSLLLLFSCNSKHHKVVETYPNGKKKIEFVYSERNDVVGDVLLNGEKLAYDSLGNLARRGEYKEGKLNGVEILFYPSGVVKEFTTVRNDSAYGFEYTFDEYGDTLKAYVHYGLSIKNVFYQKWLHDGKLLGIYGDSDRSFVIWKWLDSKGREVKEVYDTGVFVNEEFKRFIAPE